MLGAVKCACAEGVDKTSNCQNVLFGLSYHILIA
jgi:hypothetical protein